MLAGELCKLRIISCKPKKLEASYGERPADSEQALSLTRTQPRTDQGELTRGTMGLSAWLKNMVGTEHTGAVRPKPGTCCSLVREATRGALKWIFRGVNKTESTPRLWRY